MPLDGVIELRHVEPHSGDLRGLVSGQALVQRATNHDASYILKAAVLIEASTFIEMLRNEEAADMQTLSRFRLVFARVNTTRDTFITIDKPYF